MHIKQKYTTFVLGGGLAGLSAGYHGNFPVFEAQAFPGGTAASIKKEGFVFDLGIHVFNSKARQFYDLLNQLGVPVVVKVRKGYIYSFDSFVSYPIQVNTHHLPIRKRFECVAGYFFRKKDMTPENYEDWLNRNFGTGFSRNFLIPYSEKFWGVKPREMTFEWTGARVPQARLLDVVKGALRNHDAGLGPNAEFRYPSSPGEGYGALGEALASRVKEIYYSMKATTIDPQSKTVSFNGGKVKVAYENLITTLPLPELVQSLPSAPAAIHEAAGKLRWNSIAVINLGVDKPFITDKHWIHFPEKEISFFRISFPANFCPGLSPPMQTPIQAEISYDMKNPPAEQDLLALVRHDLIKTGIISAQDSVSFQDVHYLPYGYVIFDFNRKQAVETLHEFFEKFNIYSCGRYGEWAYLWSDEAIESGKAAAKKMTG